MSLGTIAGAVAGGATLASYLNAKFHIGKDIQGLLVQRRGLREYSNAAAQGRGNGWFLFIEAVKKYPDMTRDPICSLLPVQGGKARRSGGLLPPEQS
ncbi:hypothetical protein AWENTII_000337 [Aspergillus wentii]